MGLINIPTAGNMTLQRHNLLLLLVRLQRHNMAADNYTVSKTLMRYRNGNAILTII